MEQGKEQELRDMIKRLDNHMAYGVILILIVLFSLEFLTSRQNQSCNDPAPMSQPKGTDDTTGRIENTQGPRPQNFSMTRILQFTAPQKFQIQPKTMHIWRSNQRYTEQ